MSTLLNRKTGSFESEALPFIRESAYPLTSPIDLNPLLESIADARIVMLGEASHGTHEYYTWRTAISKRLITEKKFNFIAVEGDWPDAYQLNRYIKNYPDAGKTAEQVLKTYDRWPTWMWANWEVAALAEWLKAHNAATEADLTGFYGLDVYSLWDSLGAILNYLEKSHPSALAAAEKAFRCFEPYKTDDGSAYAYSSSSLVPGPCEEDVLKLLSDIQQLRPHYPGDAENAFSAEQNAFIAVNAEKYYRTMMHGMTDSWNVRDSHMFDSLLRLLQYHGKDSKAIIWAHNTHIGDARATDMADEGMYNIGELARKHFGEKDVCLVGFGSYKGSVIAGKRWGATMEKMKVPEATRDSWEYLLHKASPGNKLLLMNTFKKSLFAVRIGHRAIGVVYNPGFESYGNYVPSVLPDRYDAFLFIDETTALHPLHLHSTGGEMPDTYPFGM